MKLHFLQLDHTTIKAREEAIRTLDWQVGKLQRVCINLNNFPFHKLLANVTINPKATGKYLTQECSAGSWFKVIEEAQ